MNPVKLMTLLILIAVLGILIAVAIFIFQLNLTSNNAGAVSFALWWQFVKTHPMYSFGLISPMIAVVFAIVKVAGSKFEKFSFS